MTTSDQARLGSALRLLRLQRALTQEDLAKLAELDAPYLSRVESGTRDLRWSTVMRLLRALDATLADLGRAMKDVDTSKD